jgi:hypothetical protein
MYVRPSAPRDIGGVIDDAIKLYRASFRTCWLIALIGSVLSAATLVFFISRFPAIMSVRDPAQLWQMLRPTPVWLWFLVPSLASLVLLGAIIACQSALAAGRAPMNVGQAIVTGFSRLHRQLLTILLWLLYFVAIIVLMLAPLPGFLKVLTFLAWFIFAIYLWGKLQLWIVAVYADDAATLQAMGISWDFIQGHWWRAVTILTVGIIIVIVITMIFSFVAGLVLLMFRLEPMSLLIGNQILSAAERVFVTSMIPALLVAMYYDLKLRREGGDLAARTKSLQTA